MPALPGVAGGRTPQRRGQDARAPRRGRRPHPQRRGLSPRPTTSGTPHHCFHPQLFCLTKTSGRLIVCCMHVKTRRNAPGQVRDAILAVMNETDQALSGSQIYDLVVRRIGKAPKSSVRSYLLLNTPEKFIRTGRGLYQLRVRGHEEDLRKFVLDDNSSVLFAREEAIAYDADADSEFMPFRFGKSELFNADCLDWLSRQEDCSIHAVVTDPPYGIREYTDKELTKLRTGCGGVWRMPPSFDGNRRSPLPRFTVLNQMWLDGLRLFFVRWGRAVLPKLVPGANVVMASNPLLAPIVSAALSDAGLERRGELVRLTMTMRGGDRPKNAEAEFGDVSVMPRSMWEPWLLFRKPLEGRVQDNLRKWGTGGFRRIGPDRPFGDVIKSAPTHKAERALANHPSLKPQSFLRQIVRAVLPLGRGVVVDTFAGSGSTLAAAEAIGYESKGVERDREYWELACRAIPRLSRMTVRSDTAASQLNGGASVPTCRCRSASRRSSEPDTATLPLVF